MVPVSSNCSNGKSEMVVLLFIGCRAREGKAANFSGRQLFHSLSRLLRGLLFVGPQGPLIGE